MRHGRPKTTGRFRTRAELVDRVRFQWHYTPAKLSQIAHNCGVSPGVVDSITLSREWDSLEPHDYLYSDPADDGATGSLREQEAPDLAHLSHRRVIHEDCCGHGYTPEPCSVHLPDWIKRDLELI